MEPRAGGVFRVVDRITLSPKPYGTLHAPHLVWVKGSMYDRYMQRTTCLRSHQQDFRLSYNPWKKKPQSWIFKAHPLWTWSVEWPWPSLLGPVWVGSCPWGVWLWSERGVWGYGFRAWSLSPGAVSVSVCWSWEGWLCPVDRGESGSRAGPTHVPPGRGWGRGHQPTHLTNSSHHLKHLPSLLRLSLPYLITHCAHLPYSHTSCFTSMLDNMTILKTGDWPASTCREIVNFHLVPVQLSWFLASFCLQDLALHPNGAIYRQPLTYLPRKYIIVPSYYPHDIRSGNSEKVTIHG